MCLLYLVANFRRIRAVTFCNTVSEIRKTQFFDGFWGFLQLGVVSKTSNLAHITLTVHIFAGKKEFFKLVKYFFLFRITHIQTHIHTSPAKDKYCYRFFLIYLLNKVKLSFTKPKITKRVKGQLNKFKCE